MRLRRDAATGLVAVCALAGLLVGAVALGLGLLDAVTGPRAVPWDRSEVADDGRTVTVWYEPPCGSHLSGAEVVILGKEARVTVHVEGWAPICSAEYRQVAVEVQLPGPVGPDLDVVDGRTVPNSR